MEVMRTLIVYEDSHRAYGETMERTIRALHLEAELAHLRDLEGELKDFDPHTVVCGHPNTFDPGAGRRGSCEWRSRTNHRRFASEVGGRGWKTRALRSCWRSSSESKRSRQSHSSGPMGIIDFSSIRTPPGAPPSFPRSPTLYQQLLSK
jgi:hypothetical protein